MTGTPERKDLIVLAADKGMESALKGVLSRTRSLRIRNLAADVFRHPGHDCGCRAEGAAFLASLRGQYRHALLVFDYEGCGVTGKDAAALEGEIEEALRRLWGRSAAVVVIDPELEAWVWNTSPHVPDVLGWQDRHPDVLTWLAGKGFDFSDGKPDRPKEAVQAVLREVKRPLSSAMYQRLAERVSPERCTDRAFGKLTAVLERWFGADGEQADKEK